MCSKIVETRRPPLDSYFEEEAEEEPVTYEKCKGCPNPVDGSKGHKFSCSVAGVRASQVILPVTISPDGKVSVIKNTKDE